MMGVVPTSEGGSGGEVILGASTTQLCANLAGCFDELLQPGDEVVVHRSGHEANIGPWVRLAARVVGLLVQYTSSINAADTLASLNGALVTW